ncbi:MAG: hypothetical protein WD336_06055 [Trueperaceae bacterium]
MTIRIGDLTTELATHDVAALRVMAERVVHDRPSFRTVAGRVGNEPVQIFTTRRGGATERLSVAGPSTRLDVPASDRRTLFRLLADAN